MKDRFSAEIRLLPPQKRVHPLCEPLEEGLKRGKLRSGPFEEPLKTVAPAAVRVEENLKSVAPPARRLEEALKRPLQGTDPVFEPFRSGWQASPTRTRDYQASGT